MALIRAVKYVNYEGTNLTDAILAADTSITIDDPSVLPVIGVGEHFYLVLTDGNGVREIVRGTDVVGSVVSVDRGVDDTAALDFDAGSPIETWYVKIIFDDIRADLDGCLGTVEDVIDDTDIIINENEAEIASTDIQNQINTATSTINAAAIVDLGEDITDLVFADLTDVTEAGQAAWLAAQGSGATLLNPMIKRSDVPLGDIGKTYFRSRLEASDWSGTGSATAQETITGLDDGDYILMGTFQYFENASTPTPVSSYSSTFEVTINTVGPVTRVYAESLGSLQVLAHYAYRTYMVPFTISGVTEVVVDFTTVKNNNASSYVVEFTDILAVRVA